MLRINLLPPYVQQRRLTKKLVPAFIALFLLAVALPLAAFFALHQKLTQLTQDAADAVSGKAKTDSYKAEAATTLTQIGPIQSKLQFMTDCDAYARKQIARLTTLADTTPRNSLLYTAVTITGTTMTIKAYSPSVEEVGRYLQVMYHEPDFTTVAVDHVPAYPDNIRHLYYLDGVLVFADGATGGAGGGGGAAPTGPLGGPGGGQAAGGGAPTNFTPQALGPNGPLNLPPGVGPPPPEIAVGGPGGASAGAGGFRGGAPAAATAAGTGAYSENFLRIAGRGVSPFASPAVREQIYQKALRRVVVKTVPKGFDINVTATLKEALTPPTLPGAAPAAGAARGGFPGGPGGPGRSPGPPGGAP